MFLLFIMRSQRARPSWKVFPTQSQVWDPVQDNSEEGLMLKGIKENPSETKISSWIIALTKDWSRNPSRSADHFPKHWNSSWDSSNSINLSGYKECGYTHLPIFPPCLSQPCPWSTSSILSPLAFPCLSFLITFSFNVAMPGSLCFSLGQRTVEWPKTSLWATKSLFSLCFCRIYVFDWL